VNRLRDWLADPVAQRRFGGECEHHEGVLQPGAGGAAGGAPATGAEDTEDRTGVRVALWLGTSAAILAVFWLIRQRPME
jgi:hypothetical protein